MSNFDLLKRALEIIPGGGQTDTKTTEFRLLGIQPSFFIRGKGVYAEDPDGVWWLDCQMGLAAYILGYNDPKINRQIIEQLNNGSIFSLSSPLESEVAETLLSLFPEFDMVRFAKNGSDVTSAAIRIARRYTGRDHVIGCGYHGFQDWSMSMRPIVTGIPGRVRDLTKGREDADLSNALSLLDETPEKYAAVIVDTGGYGIPDISLLGKLRDKCHECGTVFIMDEVVSGFRVSLRGTLGYSSVVPDMICLGKALANGFPLSALVGTKHLLQLAVETGMSSTYGGDCIGLAATKATLAQLKDGAINNLINKTGEALIKTINGSIRRHGLTELLEVVGYPALFDLVPRKNDVDKRRLIRYLMRGLAQHRIFWQESFVICRDFGAKEISLVSAALEDTLSELSAIVRQGRLAEVSDSIDRQEEKYKTSLSGESLL